MPEERIRELERANEALKEFVAVAAHEIRGPMAAILGYASTMQRRWDDLPTDQRKEFLSIIERRSRYLTRLLDSLLTISKIEAGALEVQPEVLSVAEVVEEALEDLPGDTPIAVRVEDGCKVKADPDHLERIVVNFLRNAQKYGAPPYEVTAAAANGQVTITVADEGDGVAPAFVDDLFEKFARENIEPTERGTGLGLSITRGMARANGGDAWYEPGEPRGSRFHVRLPAV